ncbi:DUF4435 domain-containing protein [Listeria innocua]|uniref:DUF4435 domain-containing protein n=1 Tax=Listeria innocua TaxID=1642 RepID=UPI0028934606|nr:DUF4435 domain-containing protein [Listeria innocua]
MDSMQKATEEPTSVWIEYISAKQKKCSRSRFFCFFEGEDRKYYVERIKKRINEDEVNVLAYICDNRDGVITIYKKALSENDDMKCLLFFIDRDYNLDSYENDEFVYQTPEYSIENFYSKRSVVENIMEIEFGIQPESEDMCFVLDLYETLFKDFINYYSCVNIWYIACKEIGLSVKISGFKPKSDISLQSGKLVIKNSSININEISEYYLELLQKDKIKNKKYAQKNIDEYSKKHRGIKDSIKKITCTYNCDKDFRGKFILEFFKMFISYIVELNKEKKLNKIYEMVYIDVWQKNILSALSKHAVTPECLDKYIANHEPLEAKKVKYNVVRENFDNYT